MPESATGTASNLERGEFALKISMHRAARGDSARAREAIQPKILRKVKIGVFGSEADPPKVVSRAAERSGECASKNHAPEGWFHDHAPGGCEKEITHTCRCALTCTCTRSHMCVPESVHTCAHMHVHVCTRRVHEIHAPEA